MKKEFAYQYFHKSDILYRFIRAYQQEKYRKDLAMQYNYITNSFSTDKLITYMKRSSLKRVNILSQSNQVEICKSMQCMSLYIHVKHLALRCETLLDAEVFLLPSLPRFHPFLFIIENQFDN